MVKSHSNLGRSLNTGTANPGALNTDIFDIEKNYAVWILVDILFYTLSLLLSTHITRYETCILMCLDLFLLVVKDEYDKLKIFHSLPKVFVLHVKGNPFIVVMSVVLILSHLRQQHKSYKSILFFLAITCGVYFASFGISKMYAASFGVSVIAAFVYMWETATFTAIPRLDDDLRFEQLLKKEDIVMKDHAIAQDLVAKLKKLKVALSIEKERNKKIEKDPLLRLVRYSPVSRSVILYDCEEVSC